MAQMKFKRYGKTVTVTFHEPSNEEHNEFGNAMSVILKSMDDDTGDAAIIALHTATFDRWAEKVEGCDKADLTGRQKSVMLTRFLSIEEIDEKN